MKLTNEVAVYVPSTIGESNADQALISRIVDQALTDLSLVNGGATVTKGIGAWLSQFLAQIIIVSIAYSLGYWLV